MLNNYELNSVFSGLKPSSTLYVNETVKKLWSQNEQVFHMGFGESRFDVHPLLKEAISTHSDKKSYLPGRGLAELIDNISTYYTSKLDTTIKSEQVMVGPGSKALLYTLQMILNADLFLPSPSWVSYAPQATLLGLKHFYVPSKFEHNYKIELESLDQCVQKSNNPNKLLILNSPNNPSGELIDKDTLKEIADYCRKNNILVISDEIYFQVVSDESETNSISEYYPEGTFVLGGLSKHLSIGGWRLGIAITPDTDFGKRVMQLMTVYASELWSGVSSPIQYAAITAYSLNEEIEQYVRDCASIHSIRTNYIKNELNALGIESTGAKGGFYLMPNFNSYRNSLNKLNIHTSADLAKYLLDKHKIASLPGSDFGFQDEEMALRLSTSYLDLETDIDAEKIFSLYKSGVESDTFMNQENHPNTHSAILAFGDFISSMR